MNLQFRRAILLFFLLEMFCFGRLVCQNNKIDSLIKLIKNSKTDTVRINAMNALGWILMYEKQDSAIKIGYSSLTTALKSGYQKFIGKSYNQLGVYFWMNGLLNSAIINEQKSLEVYKKINHLNGIMAALGNLAAIYNDKGDFYKSIDLYLVSSKMADSIGNKKTICTISGNMGVTYAKLGNYPKALELYTKSLKMAEELNNNNLIALSIGYIGGLYFATKEFKKSLSYYIRALEVNEKQNNKVGISRELANIGLTYWSLGENEKALSYFNQSLEIKKNLSEAGGTATVMHYIGNVYFSKNEFDKAYEYFINTLNIIDKLGFNEMKSNVLGNIGAVYFKKKNYPKAEEYILKSLAINKSGGDLNGIRGNYSGLADLYSKMGKWQKAYEAYLQFSKTNDSLFNKEKSKEMGRIEASAEYEKIHAVTEIAHKKELEKQETISKIEKQRQKAWLIFVLVIALAIGVIAIIIFTSLKLARKQKQIIQLQKNEVEFKNKEILDSITYAKRLQDAILIPEMELKQTFSDAFVLYKPKDIVAGDFYWMHNFNNGNILIAAADCTGHGVPGAMMSIVCSNALARSAFEFKKIKPGEILDKTREIILDTLSKNNADVKDGMDISLCLVNTKTNEIEWSGANNSLVYVSEEKLIEIKSDKQPVGKYINPKPFTNHRLKLKNGDTIFLFTDGYADQFGGPDGKKFKYKNLHQNLLKLSAVDCAIQKESLGRVIDEWRGDLEQIDDICVLGIKI